MQITEKPGIVTFSRNVFIPLTNACRNRCHYCGFRSDKPSLMTPVEVSKLLSKAINATEALFTFGEKPDEVEGVSEKLKSMGFRSFIDYLLHMNALAIEHGKLPHTNAGVLRYEEMKRLKGFNASMGLMLEQAVELECHENSPGKKPEERIRTIINAGKLQIPFTTGILVGIGENLYEDLYSLDVISELHSNYGHIQECIIQNFKPKKGTVMENTPPPSAETMLKIVREARKILPQEVEIQIPPNLVDDISPFIKAGAGDIGGISDTTIDYINPEAPWPEIEKIERCLKGEYFLKERLAVYPRFIKVGWYGKHTGHLIEQLADENGYRKNGYVSGKGVNEC